MDGSVSTLHNETPRSQVSRLFANKTNNEASAHSELFEQLLNLTFTIEPPVREPFSESETPAAESSGSAKSSNQVEGETPYAEENSNDNPINDVAAALIQATPLVTENPLDPNSGQTSSETTLNVDSTIKADSPHRQVPQESQPSTADSKTDNQLSSDIDEPAYDSTTSVATSGVETTKIAASSIDRRNNSNAEDSKASAIAAQPREVTTASATEPITKDEHASTGSPQAQESTVNNLETSQSQRAAGDDRYADRREKWFERKGSASRAAETGTIHEPAVSAAQHEKQDLAIPLPAPDSQWQITDPFAPMNPPISNPPNNAPNFVPTTLPIAAQVNSVIANSPPASAASNPSSEASNVSTATPTRTTGTQTAKAEAKDAASQSKLSQQERVRIVQRIARSFNRINADGGQINLRLHPAHLGSVSVQVRLEGRSLSAKLSTETAAARDAIMQDLPALRQRLSDQGFDVTKFQVDVTGNGADATFSQTSGQSHSGDSESRSSGSQIDYRRIAAHRDARNTMPRQLLPSSTLAWQTGTGIDLQA